MNPSSALSPCCADSATGLTDRPRPHEDEVRFILEAISEYLTVKVRRSDVLSSWAGIRPLAQDPNASSTEAASRDHIVTRDADGLLTVTGLPAYMLRVCLLSVHLPPQALSRVLGVLKQAQ